MMHYELIPELEGILKKVNGKLRKVLKGSMSLDVRKALKDLEQFSRWRRAPIPEGRAGLRYAKRRAELKAKKSREPFVVCELGYGDLVVVPKARLVADKPFGLGKKDILYETAV